MSGGSVLLPLLMALLSAPLENGDGHPDLAVRRATYYPWICGELDDRGWPVGTRADELSDEGGRPKVCKPALERRSAQRWVRGRGGW